MGSWKTTSAGLLMIAGGIIRFIFAVKAKTITEESVISSVTAIVAGIGLMFARDNNVTSETAGAVTPLKDSLDGKTPFNKS